MRGFLLAGVMAVLTGCAATAGQVATKAAHIPAFEDRSLDAVTEKELVRYAGEGEFRRYLKTLERLKDRREQASASAGGQIVVAAIEPASRIDRHVRHAGLRPAQHRP